MKNNTGKKVRGLFLIHLKNTLPLVFVLLLTLRLPAQLREFKNYTTKAGLLTDEVYNLHQDRQGYVWVFSPYGTLKYNGSEFKPVLKNLSFKESFIYAIYENSKGRKWVANSNARIYEVRNDSAFLVEGFEEVSALLRNSVSEILKLHVDDSLNIYIITKGLSYKLNFKNGHYVPAVLCDALTKECITIKTLRAETELLSVINYQESREFDSLCGKTQVYLKLKRKKNDLYIPLPFNYSKTSTRPLKEINGTVYFAQTNNLFIVHANNALVRVKIGNSVILNYTEDKNRHVWVSCLHDGLYELNEKDSVVSHYFANTTINDLLVDHENELWLSTPSMGLFRSQNSNYKSFGGPKLSNTEISLLKIINNELFVANAKGDFFFIKKNKLNSITFIKNDTPFDILKHKNNYLVACRFDLKKFDLQKKLRSTVFFNEPFSRRIFPKGSDTLIYTWRGGISFSVNDSIQKRIICGHKILSALLSGNRLWLGTDDGVYQYRPLFFSKTKQRLGLTPVYDKDSLQQPSYLKATQNSIVSDIEEDPLHALWFCTSGSGLFRLANAKLVNYTTEHGLPGNIINHISFRGNDSVLLATNKGLYISGFNPATGLFKEWNSIYEGEVQKALVFENKIYLGSRDGLVSIDYWKGRSSGEKLFFNLAGIHIDSVEVLPANFKTIKSSQRAVEFKFDYIAFSDADIVIKYILLGPSKDSGFVKHPLIRFSRLSPGDYTLCAFPAIKHGEKLKITIPFRVEPAFWQTVFFQILFFIVMIFLMTLLMWLIIKYNKNKEAVKTRNEQLILEYKLIALKAQINPHFISNCLSAIQELVVSNNSDKATFYIAEFGLMVRQILDFSSRKLISLQEELDLLKIYVELEQLRFENAFGFEIRIEEGFMLKEIYVPPLILNPLVENAIWHGLLPVQGHKPLQLLITIKASTASLVLSVEDNGAGRQANKSAISNTKGTSYGIKLTEQRLSNINYLYSQNSARMVYEDRYDPLGKASGTRVTIYLPKITTLQNE